MSAGRTGIVGTFRIHYVDGSAVNVKTGLPDVLRWERNHEGQPWAAAALAVTNQLQLMFYAGRRMGVITEPIFEEWLLTVEDYGKTTDDEVLPDPTQTDRSGD